MKNGNFCLERMASIKTTLNDRYETWRRLNPNTKLELDMGRIFSVMAARDKEELAIRAKTHRERRSANTEQAHTEGEGRRHETTKQSPQRSDHDEESRRTPEAAEQTQIPEAEMNASEDARIDEARTQDAEAKERSKTRVDTDAVPTAGADHDQSEEASSSASDNTSQTILLRRHTPPTTSHSPPETRELRWVFWRPAEPPTPPALADAPDASTTSRYHQIFDPTSRWCLDGRIARPDKHPTASGGYADVWKGILQEKLQEKPVAIKVMRPFASQGGHIHPEKLYKVRSFVGRSQSGCYI
jgi:hypothetical protein